MFGKDELMRFLYGFCLGKEAVATFDSFQVMVEKVLEFEDSKFPAVKQKKVWEMFCTQRGDMFWEGFKKLIQATPLLLWPVQRLQSKLIDQNLGEVFWRSQKQSMIDARKRLGIRRDLS
mmetsp:Transcript_14885/g.30593  ORF Transcript_14885/g.30593 Transcript_14885/m.30593 type:complete len:119 (-) Transcript_14885:162-518(-)